MRFKPLNKSVKAGLTPEEINQLKSKFNVENWTPYELYNPDANNDSSAFDALIDIIEWDYLTDEQKERIEYSDYEKIIGITEEQFNKNRELFVEERRLENLIDEYTDDFSKLEEISDVLADVNFSYEFVDKFYSDKFDLEEKIDKLDKRLDEIKAAIKNITPKFKHEEWRK